MGWAATGTVRQVSSICQGLEKMAGDMGSRLVAGYGDGGSSAEEVGTGTDSGVDSSMSSFWRTP